MQSLCTEEADILLGKLQRLDGHAFVAVIEVEAHTALEARADDREVITAIACADACQLEERMEDGVRRDGLTTIGAPLSEELWVGISPALVAPDEERYVELVVGDVGRGVEEALAFVIIDVLPVVGDIDHRSGTIASLEDADDGVDELIRLAHGIVIGIAQDEAVGLRSRVVPLHREEGILLRIAVTVAEVTTVGVQHDEELRVLTRHEALQIGDHIAIVETALLTAKLLTDGVMLVPLHSEEVHIAVVPWLIGDEGRIEARFTEGREDPLHMGQILRRRRIGRREDDRDTLIRRIRLSQDVSEGDKPTITVERIDMRRRLTGIAVEAPAVRT